MIVDDYLTLPQRIKAIYNDCNEEEQGYLIQILEELSETGTSATYDTLWLSDYKEIPVDIDTFLVDDRYLGSTNRNGAAVYPYWRQVMSDIFSSDPNKYEEVVFTGATRIGKTSTAVTCMIYMLYKLMCLRDPQKFFGKKDVSKFSIFFFNLTKDLAKGVSYREFNDTVWASPWFREHGTISKSDRNFYYIPEGGKIVIDYGSDAAHGLGQQVFASMMDEIAFAKAGVKDISKAKEHMKSLYDTIVARVQGTFRMGGQVYGKIFSVSSKKTDSDFLEQHVQDQLSAGNEHMYVADKPQWEVLPASMFSPERFYIAIGDRHHKGFVLEDSSEEAREELKSQGYTLMEVPIDMKTNFIADFDISLRDLAGISVPGALSFITQEAVTSCIGDRHNPFLQAVLEIGTKDSYTIEEFYHDELVPNALKHCNIFLHLDLSLNDDRTGIGATGISSRMDIKGEDGKVVSMPAFSHIFSVAIQAPRGDKIPYAKITQFIVWLRRHGYNIVGISRDQFQSEYMAQLLEAQGFKVGKISVDRTPDPYMALRSLFLEKRIDLLPVEELQDELIHLQRDALSGKIDHPIGGCFVESTKIQLVDGRILTIRELLTEQSYKSNWVYTMNEISHKIEPKRIKRVFQTKLVTELLRITLDNGETIMCTPEHRFMLRDGSYVEAKDLYTNDSLMPLYLKISDNGLKGYRLYYEPFEDSWHYEHRQFHDADKIPKNYVVHHANYNPLDNTPTNLVVMSRSKHRQIHNNKTQNYDAISSSLQHYHATHKEDESYKLRNEKISKAVIANLKAKDPNYIPLAKKQADKIQQIELMFNVKWDDLSQNERNSYSVKYARVTDPSITERISKSLSEQHAKGIFKNAEAAISGRKWYTNGTDNIYIKTYENVPNGYYPGRVIDDATKIKRAETQKSWTEEQRKAYSKRQSENTSNRIWVTNGTDDKYICKDEAIPEGYHRGRSKYRKNHSVVSVERIHTVCKVYDLEIEDNHNFALAAGIFVHNSKDMSDCIAGSIWNAMLSNPGVPVNRSSVARSIARVNNPANKGTNPRRDFGNMFPDNRYKQ